MKAPSVNSEPWIVVALAYAQAAKRFFPHAHIVTQATLGNDMRHLAITGAKPVSITILDQDDLFAWPKATVAMLHQLLRQTGVALWGPAYDQRTDVELLDPDEEQIRRIRLALFTKFKTEGHKGKLLSTEEAKSLAFRMGGRRHGSRFLEEKSNVPNAESRNRAQEKLHTPDAEEKRQAYEKMLAEGRKSGTHRITKEHLCLADGPLVYRVQPGNYTFAAYDAAYAHWAKINRKL